MNIDPSIERRFDAAITRNLSVPDVASIVERSTEGYRNAVLSHFSTLVSTFVAPDDSLLYLAIARAESTKFTIALPPEKPKQPVEPVVMLSKWPGWCRTCRGSVRVGDRIAWAKHEGVNYVAHEKCGLSIRVLAKPKTA